MARHMQCGACHSPQHKDTRKNKIQRKKDVLDIRIVPGNPYNAWIECYDNTYDEDATLGIAEHKANLESARLQEHLTKKQEKLKCFQDEVRKRVTYLQKLKKEEDKQKALKLVQDENNLVLQRTLGIQFPYKGNAEELQNLNKELLKSCIIPCKNTGKQLLHVDVEHSDKIVEHLAAQIREDNLKARSKLFLKKLKKYDRSLPGGMWRSPKKQPEPETNIIIELEVPKELPQSAVESEDIREDPPEAVTLEEGKCKGISDEDGFSDGNVSAETPEAPLDSEDLTDNLEESNLTTDVTPAETLPVLSGDEGQADTLDECIDELSDDDDDDDDDTSPETSKTNISFQSSKEIFDDDDEDYDDHLPQVENLDEMTSDNNELKSKFSYIYRDFGKDAEVEKVQKTNQFWKYRKIFMDIERDQVKEKKKLEDHRKKVQQLKLAKERERKSAEKNITDFTERPLASKSNESAQPVVINNTLVGKAKKDKEDLLQEKEMFRYMEALRKVAKERIKLCAITIPPLCSCATDFFDSHPDKCANNCVFYKNIKVYVSALTSALANTR